MLGSYELPEPFDAEVLEDHIRAALKLPKTVVARPPEENTEELSIEHASIEHVHARAPCAGQIIMRRTSLRRRASLL